MAPAMQRTGHSMAPAIEPTLFDRARAQCNGARARKMMSATLRHRAQKRPHWLATAVIIGCSAIPSSATRLSLPFYNPPTPQVSSQSIQRTFHAAGTETADMGIDHCRRQIGMTK